MRAERIDLYPAQLRRGRVPLRCQAGGTQGYDRGSGSGVESGWTEKQKMTFSEGGHSAGCFVPFRLRNSSVVPAQLRIFIQNQWLKSAYRAEKYRLCSDRSHTVVLLVTIVIFFFLICFENGLKYQKT